MGDDGALQDQWKKKKQTKAEAKAARKGKLDPDSELNRNAKEVMDERASNKRKLREMERGDEDDAEDFEPAEGVETEKPGQGLKKKMAESNKKQKHHGSEDENEDDWEDEEVPDKDTDAASDAQKTQPKLSKKEAKKAAKKDKRKEKRVENKTKNDPVQPDPTADNGPAEAPESTPTAKAQKNKKKDPKKDDSPPAEAQAESSEQAISGDDAGGERGLGFSRVQKDDGASTTSTPQSAPHSPTFDTNASNDAPADPASTSTSVSSTVPPSEKPKHIKIPSDTSALRARLAAKIEALRAARKADGPDGKPIRTRQELIESRRAKQAQRKAHKKELRNQAKIEEERKREEALASNSPSVMSPTVELDDSQGNFAFGRVAFGDGAQMSHDLSYVLNNNKKKGPSDPKTALLKVQAQKKRLQELDAEKRKDIGEKETWLTARRRAEGEKIRDDEAILKKAVKRKETGKKKSEKAWKERQKGVQMAQKEKQKKRDENIKKRREDKVLGKAGKKKGGGVKKKGRPGFEGSLGVGGRRK